VVQEAQRIIRISDEVRMSLEVVNKEDEAVDGEEAKEKESSKLTSSKVAQKLGLKTAEFMDKVTAAGFLEARDGKHYLTQKGKDSGGEFRMSPKHGPYFLWPEAFKL
jgi:hypothetical protein